jgi:hypothetical protein
MPQKETKKKRSSENVISTDKSALLWMYCREIAPFETPTFSKNVGELIARATRAMPRVVARLEEERRKVDFHRSLRDAESAALPGLARPKGGKKAHKNGRGEVQKSKLM